jgi:predicted alpha/beta superfamily hydrolase
MDKRSRYLLLSIATMLLLVSCKEESTNKSIETSVVESIEVTSDKLSHTKKIDVYLPMGYNKENTYPTLFMESGRQWQEFEYKHIVDSLIETGTITPIIIVVSQEDNMKISGTDHFYYEVELSANVAKGNVDFETMNKNYESFYLNELLPAIESKYAISKDKDSRIYYGTMYGADFGISLGMTNPDLFGEYWCFSPAHSSVEHFGMIPGKTTFRICWGTKETVNADNYYPSLLSGIKKRGGTVTNLTFEGRPSGMQWKEQFKQRLIAKFSYQTNR